MTILVQLSIEKGIKMAQIVDFLEFDLCMALTFDPMWSQIDLCVAQHKVLLIYVSLVKFYDLKPALD